MMNKAAVRKYRSHITHVTFADSRSEEDASELRGLLLERKQGCTPDDYALPERAYTKNPNVKLPHFITPEFWQELRQRVLTAFDAQLHTTDYNKITRLLHCQSI